MSSQPKPSSRRKLPIGIGTTFDYSVPFEPMCRMVAQAGFRAITIGGGDLAHSGYETEEGRARIRHIVNDVGLKVDSVHAPFGPECDLSIPDIQIQAATRSEESESLKANKSESQLSDVPTFRPGTPCPSAQSLDATGETPPGETALPGDRQSVAPGPPPQASDAGAPNSPLPPRLVFKSSPARLAAVARVKNAIDAAMALDCQIVIIHPVARSSEAALQPDTAPLGPSLSVPVPHPSPPSADSSFIIHNSSSSDDFPAQQTRARIHALRDSVSELIPYARHRNVRLALENLPSLLSMQVFEAVLDEFPELGVCYDSSHAQISTNPFGVLQRYRERIIATHISDNRGSKDDHMLPFEGVIDWEEFAFYFSKIRCETDLPGPSSSGPILSDPRSPIPDPRPPTLNPQSSTPNPKPKIGKAQPPTQNPKPKIQNPEALFGPQVFMLEVEVRESAFKDTREFLTQAYERAQRLLDM